MATGNITRLEGVWPETHERAVRDSAGVNLETKLGNINSNISQLDQEVDEKVNGIITKDIIWTDGYFGTNGVINGSSVSKFSQPFLLKAGESVYVGSQSSSACVIGRTDAVSVAVGDSITPLVVAPSTSAFVVYSFKAPENMNVVICCKWATHTLEFRTEDSLPGDIDIIEKKAEANGFELTQSPHAIMNAASPDYDKMYWSAGGVLTSHQNYKSCFINVENFRNKKIAFRSGLINSNGLSIEYNWIKKTDGTCIPLSGISTIDSTDLSASFVVPSDAVALYISWDAVSFQNYEKMAFAQIEGGLYDAVSELQTKTDNISDDVKELESKFDVVVIPLIDYANPDYTDKYWSAYDTLSNANGYKASAIDVTQYAGCECRLVAGYSPRPNEFYFGDYCWIKYSDGTTAKLSTLSPVYDYTNMYAIITLPLDAVEVKLSWDDSANGIYARCGVHAFMDVYTKPIIPVMEGIVLTKKNKNIYLYGDSISSTTYPWYKEYLEKYTGGIVIPAGHSGWNAKQLATNQYFDLLASSPSDYIVMLVGTNDIGNTGTVGTFSENSPLHEMGESIVSESDINSDFLVSGTVTSGTFQSDKMIVALSHIVRKWQATYANFRLAANLYAKIYDTENNNIVVYPTSGDATEAECISYAQSQGWVLARGNRYIMMTAETVESKREKLMAVKQPKLYICTVMPTKYINASNAQSDPQNWERKRLACIEVAEKYGIPCIDLAKDLAIDWSFEPYAPGMGYTNSVDDSPITGTSPKTDNQGIYTMDGVHPNEFGYKWISQIVAKHLD